MNTLFSNLFITGEDAEVFLNGQFTCDVSQLKNQTCCWGAYCNLKGRMTSLFIISKINPNQFILLLPQSIENHTLKKLLKYAAFSKVNINNTPPQYLQFSTEPSSFIVIPDLLYLKSNSSPQTQNNTNISDYLTLLLSSGYAFLTPKTQGLWLPQEIYLDKKNGVAFDKGCYLGQEIIARLHYRGQLKKVFCCFKIDQNLDKIENKISGGESIEINSQKIGEVVNCIYNPQNNTLLCTAILNSNKLNKISPDQSNPDKSNLDALNFTCENVDLKYLKAF